MRERQRTKTLIVTLLFAYLAFCFSQQMMMTTLSLYTDSLNYSSTVAGTITTIFTIAALLGRPISGLLLNRSASKYISIVGLGLFLVGTVAYMVHTALIFIYFCRMLQGIGFSLYSTASLTQLTSTKSEIYSVRQLVGIFGVITSIAQALAPGIGLKLIEHFGFQTMFVVSALFTLIAFIATLVLPKGNSKISEALKPAQNSGQIQKRIYALAVLMFAVSFAQASVMSFLPLHAKTMEIGDISIYYAVSAASLIVSRLFGTRVIKSDQSKAPFVIGLILLVGVYTLISIGTSIEYYIVAALLYGLGYGLLQPSVNYAMIKCVPESRRGFANALYYCAIDFGYGLGSLVWGVVVGSTGYQHVYQMASGLVMISFVLYLFALLTQRKYKSRKIVI